MRKVSPSSCGVVDFSVRASSTKTIVRTSLYVALLDALLRQKGVFGEIVQIAPWNDSFPEKEDQLASPTVKLPAFLVKNDALARTNASGECVVKVSAS